MAIFKCKMCGGTLELTPNQTTGICQYCGTQQTLPKLNNDKIKNLYDRANHLRRHNQYDDAMKLYEQILIENSQDSEVYWSMLLCKYGIEYIIDPLTGKRIPTVNRTQYTSIFDDIDYKTAIKYADKDQKQIYQNEAQKINQLQKSILAISQKEDPFDIFICYKETDPNTNNQTLDSVLANDIYQYLTKEGYKVFYSKITLEDKLGTAYEPYIFAALHSAKVMVVVGTKKEHYEAVWVKNEWNRYLALISQGQDKTLIPAYKDMDPYDLPEEFSHLQALDMGKLGFMQDLSNNIKKVITAPKDPQTIITPEQTQGINYENLIKRAYIFLEDKEFERANQYFEDALDMDPENEKAYLGKLLVNRKCQKKEDLKKSIIPLNQDENYNKIIRFGNQNLKEEIAKIEEEIKENIKKENQRQKEIKRQKIAAMYKLTQKIYNEKLNQLPTLKKQTKRSKKIILNQTLSDIENNLEQLNKAQITLTQLKNTGLANQFNIDNQENIDNQIEDIQELIDNYDKIAQKLEKKIQTISKSLSSRILRTALFTILAIVITIAILDMLL